MNEERPSQKMTRLFPRLRRMAPVPELEPVNIFEQPTAVAGYDAVTVQVPVYQAAPARPAPRRAGRLWLTLVVFVTLAVAWGVAAYEVWSLWG